MIPTRNMSGNSFLNNSPTFVGIIFEYSSSVLKRGMNAQRLKFTNDDFSE